MHAHKLIFLGFLGMHVCVCFQVCVCVCMCVYICECICVCMRERKRKSYPPFFTTPPPLHCWIFPLTILSMEMCVTLKVGHRCRCSTRRWKVVFIEPAGEGGPSPPFYYIADHRHTTCRWCPYNLRRGWFLL